MSMNFNYFLRSFNELERERARNPGDASLTLMRLLQHEPLGLSKLLNASGMDYIDLLTALDRTTEKGLVEKTAEEKYALTETGRKALRQVV